MFIKKKDIFFETLEGIADNLLEASQYFAKEVQNVISAADLAKAMKNYESKGDRYIHSIVTALNNYVYYAPREGRHNGIGDNAGRCAGPHGRMRIAN